MSFVERFIIHCSYFGGSTIGGSTVVPTSIDEINLTTILGVVIPTTEGDHEVVG